MKTSLIFIILALFIPLVYAVNPDVISDLSPPHTSYTTETNPIFTGKAIGGQDFWVGTLQIRERLDIPFIPCGEAVFFNNTLTSVRSNASCTFTKSGNVYFWRWYLKDNAGNSTTSSESGIQWVTGMRYLTEIIKDASGIFAPLVEVVMTVGSIIVVIVVMMFLLMLIAQIGEVVARKIKLLK